MVDDVDAKDLAADTGMAAVSESEASQEPATNVRHDSVRSRVRLATVDNFQGWIPVNQHWVPLYSLCLSAII